MAKLEGPEEFFEVFRSARKEKAQRRTPPEQPRASDNLGVSEPPATVPTPSEPLVESQPDTPAKPAVESQPDTPAKPHIETRPPAPVPGTETKFPFSVFAEDEPTITFRRSTLIFVVIVIAVLLFIAYALGTRSRPPRAFRGKTAARLAGVIETRGPALPDYLRNKYVVCMKEFDHTQDAGLANARAYRDFLNTSPDAGFIRAAGKAAFIVAEARRLIVCVGPFDFPSNADINGLLPRLRALPREGVRHFANADARPLPQYARLFD